MPNTTKISPLVIYNFNGKTNASGFFHIAPLHPNYQQGQEIDITVKSTDGKSLKDIKGEIITAFVMPWGQMREIDWLLHCDIGKTGDVARQYYQDWWQDLITPTTTMIAMRLQVIKN